ncbi:hypothetical protein T12_10209 [Trichinella patagoniensis]|uniref:Uncharacterized protein n=1 Tax=Trichinella patagoniensis TaxID=990121 RepID=A0A0V0ZIE4_9BILA|nr:hypothetical protein T12_10209 [Trichinella patagoniensis]
MTDGRGVDESKSIHVAKVGIVVQIDHQKLSQRVQRSPGHADQRISAQAKHVQAVEAVERGIGSKIVRRQQSQIIAIQSQRTQSRQIVEPAGLNEREPIAGQPKCFQFQQTVESTVGCGGNSVVGQVQLFQIEQTTEIVQAQPSQFVRAQIQRTQIVHTVEDVFVKILTDQRVQTFCSRQEANCVVSQQQCLRVRRQIFRKSLQTGVETVDRFQQFTESFRIAHTTLTASRATPAHGPFTFINGTITDDIRWPQRHC